MFFFVFIGAPHFGYGYMGKRNRAINIANAKSRHIKFNVCVIYLRYNETVYKWAFNTPHKSFMIITTRTATKTLALEAELQKKIISKREAMA